MQNLTREQHPLVSIVIPVYNGSNYLREAIDSALGQTYSNIEVIVVNDGSNDEGKTRDIALSYGDSIRYIEKENGGVSSALNVGIREMHGEYFAWLSHDDVYFSEKIEKQVSFIKNQDYRPVIVYTDYDMIDSASRYIETWKIQHLEPFRICLLATWPVNGCTALIKKSLFSEVGLFDEKARYTQDYYLWFKIAGNYAFTHMPIVTLKSRFHELQGTHYYRDDANIEIVEMYKTFIDAILAEVDIKDILIYKKYILYGLNKKKKLVLAEYFLNTLSINKSINVTKRIHIFFERFAYLFLRNMVQLKRQTFRFIKKHVLGLEYRFR